ncbi:DUF5682 family protein [Dyella lutea]|uniref:DUF5682 family protein n=1 Tax=Dyella lutea TaxID=2950441 RepID=A0ABT1FG04_9GAMM|nr:DUF5682 family protein [Dyella lutea]MCP1376321.1 DUF5682 family protein [Dyella lutea]
MAADIHYFGIRHHGPGSARRLLAALEALVPAEVLIEGPADASDLLPALADPAMKPPVALLAYVVDRPGTASFYPFAEFSPEYVAVCWAVRAGVPVRFIDLPSTLRLQAAVPEAPASNAPEVPDADAPGVDAGAEGEGDAVAAESAEPSPTEASADELQRDPIGVLARAAGYEDGESWWHDWIESGAAAGEPAQVFEAVAGVMATLREQQLELEPLEARREAHMRLQIAAAARTAAGPLAVVCGAWHVPALKARHKAGDDRALLAGLAKCKTRLTWVPWTYPRLASGSGYGAGVAAPRWYRHLWRHGAGGEALSRWMVEVARTLREGGAPCSTAAVIESTRLAHALARVRERPAAGYEDMRDAAIASLCEGEALRWRQHEVALLLGNEVGEIPPDTQLLPLLEDLQRQQKSLRLKPEALERELSLDLRSDGGAARSVLLHRLLLLDVPWGRLLDAGSSRGTFRERWTLAWEPEYAVRLVEHMVYGPTIEQAAAGRSVARMREQNALSGLTALTRRCLEADLPVAVEAGLAAVAERAGHAQECGELMAALPELVSLARYGTAREIALDQLAGLAERMLVQAALALPYAAHGLDAEQSARFCGLLAGVHDCLPLGDFDADAIASWWQAVAYLSADRHASRRACGLACRLLYDAGRLASDELQARMQRMLSPGVPTVEAAQFFEGFFEQAVQRLLHDAGLLAVVDAWLATLDGEVFQEQLPLLRRVFSSLDRSERRHLLDRAVRPSGDHAGSGPGLRAPDAAWLAHEQRLLALLRGEGAWNG